MRNMDAFRALNGHGTRRAQFKQGPIFDMLKSGPDARLNFDKHTFEGLSKGICMGLTMNWIKEKTAHSRGKLSPRDFARDLTSDRRRQQVMHAGAQRQLYYDEHHEHAAFRKMGFEIDRADITPFRGADNMPSYTLGASFVEVCEKMKPGQAVLLKTNMLPPQGSPLSPVGHATAIYKSQRGTINFFDPNSGAYRVTRPREFIEAWAQAYGKREKPRHVVMDGKDWTFFECAQLPQRDSGWRRPGHADGRKGTRDAV